MQIRLDRGAVSEEFKGEIALNAKNLPKQYKNTYTWHRKKKNGGFETELIPLWMFVESGIYRLEGDTLTLCTKNGRPKGFDISKSDLSSICLMVFEQNPLTCCILDREFLARPSPRRVHLDLTQERRGLFGRHRVDVKPRAPLEAGHARQPRKVSMCQW